MITEKSFASNGDVVEKNNYTNVFEQLKADIQQTQLKAALSVTKEVTLLYWRTGKVLSEMVLNGGWGAKTLERLSRDLIRSFPDAKGFSLRNLKYMRQFVESFPDANWGHNMLLLDRLGDPAKRLWYAQQAIESGWIRSTLETWITADLYKRKGKALLKNGSKDAEAQQR